MNSKKWLSAVQLPTIKTKRKYISSDTVQSMLSIPVTLLDVSKLRQTKVYSYFQKNKRSDVEMVKQKMAKISKPYEPFSNKGGCNSIRKREITIEDDEEERALFGTCNDSLFQSDNTTIKENPPRVANIVNKISCEKKTDMKTLEDVNSIMTANTNEANVTSNIKYDDNDQNFEDLSMMSPCIVNVRTAMNNRVGNSELTRLDNAFDIQDVLDNDSSPHCINYETQDILLDAIVEQNVFQTKFNENDLASVSFNKSLSQKCSYTLNSPSTILLEKKYIQKSSDNRIGVTFPTHYTEQSSFSFRPPSPLNFTQTFTECDSEDNTIHFHPPSPLVFTEQENNEIKNTPTKRSLRSRSDIYHDMRISKRLEKTIHAESKIGSDKNRQVKLRNELLNMVSNGSSESSESCYSPSQNAFCKETILRTRSKENISSTPSPEKHVFDTTDDFWYT